MHPIINKRCVLFNALADSNLPRAAFEVFIMSRPFSTWLLSLSLALPALAAPSDFDIRNAATPVTSGRSGRISGHAAVFVNGRAVNFEGNLWMNNGRLYVPLRAISEAAGAVVRYNNSTRLITIQRGQRVLQFTPSYSSARILVPLRFLSENLGASVDLRDANNGIMQVFIDWSSDNFGPSQAQTPPFRTQSTPPVAPPAAPPALPNSTAVYAAIQHNLNQLNAYRAKAGAQALQLDPQLSEFAQQGSVELRQNHQPHGHFQRADVFNSGFQGGAAENQGDPNGWPIRGGLDATVSAILQAMMDEGPGGGHHDNMLNPKFRRVGIGLVLNGNELYLTNDFSE